MKIFAPNYYKSFKCIADKCRHSCCIGWDVYVDEDAQDKYSVMDGSLGERIRESLKEKDDGVCFEMREDGRCPFLNACGLCDIISEKGDAYISEICREHPRFYNFFSDRAEVGLGISCEEAARIVLSFDGNYELACIGEDEWEAEEPTEDELAILSKRDELIGILQGEGNIDKRVKRMLISAGASVPKRGIDEWYEVLSDLERLDALWGNYLDLLLVTSDDECQAVLEKPLENLIVYFVYRHVSAAPDKDDIACRAAFAYLGYRVISAMCAAKKKKDGKCDFADLCDFARAYSTEIEYSEENTELLLELMRRLSSAL